MTILKRATFVKDIEIVDPNSGLTVEVSIFIDHSTGGAFGVDKLFIDASHKDLGDYVFSPFDGEKLEVN